MGKLIVTFFFQICSVLAFGENLCSKAPSFQNTNSLGDVEIEQIQGESVANNYGLDKPPAHKTKDVREDREFSPQEYEEYISGIGLAPVVIGLGFFRKAFTQDINAMTQFAWDMHAQTKLNVVSWSDLAKVGLIKSLAAFPNDYVEPVKISISAAMKRAPGQAVVLFNLDGFDVDFAFRNGPPVIEYPSGVFGPPRNVTIREVYLILTHKEYFEVTQWFLNGQFLTPNEVEAFFWQISSQNLKIDLIPTSVEPRKRDAMVLKIILYLWVPIVISAVVLAQEIPQKVLIVVSSEHELILKNGVRYRTGYYLNELTVPAKALIDAGYELVFANPKGNMPEMDITSDNARYFGGDQKRYAEMRAFHDSLDGLKNPHRLADILAERLDGFAAIFIPGGHAPMTDLMVSHELGQILTYFHEADKPTAIICHGPCALVSTLRDPVAYRQALVEGDFAKAQSLATDWTYNGYNMTVFSTTEDLMAVSKMGGEVPFFPETALQSAGGIVTVGPQRGSYVKVDRKLITGQNPQSDLELAARLIQQLLPSQCASSLQ